MRYLASEKLEIIRLVGQSHLPAKRTLDKLGIPRATFNRWYDRFLTGGVDALEDRKPQPRRVWNRIPDEVREKVIDLALDEPELSPRELAVTFTDTLTMALQASGCDNAWVMQWPRLLSDNGPCDVAGELATWLNGQGMEHTRGSPCHPPTQGKIERWHQTLKNRILLENHFLPGALEAQIGAFVDHYNHRRYHESIANLTPADVYFGRGQTILQTRERIKRETINQRRLLHRKAAA
jgi:transposase InsO family protein